ncbi:MAG: MFS transporter [Acidobacteriota bacterium]
MTTFLQAYIRAFRGLPLSVWWISLVLFLNRAGTMVLPFLALYVTQELGHPVTSAGWLLSAYGVGHLAGAFLGGWLCDVVGPIRIQIWALALSGLGFLALEHVDSLWGMAPVLVFAATAAESFRPANAAALAAFAPDALQTRAVALNRLALNLGFAIGPAVGGLLATRSYDWLFRVDGATCLLASLLMVALYRRGLLEVSEHEAKRVAEDRGRHPLADRTYLLFLALIFGFIVVFFQAWGPYPVFLNEFLGLDEAAFGGLMAFNAVMILLFEMVLTAWAERFSPLAVIAWGGVAVGCGYAVLNLGTGLPLAVLSMALWTLGEMLALPFAGGWVAKRAGVRHRGKYMGLYTMVWGLAFIVAPALGSWIYEAWSPYGLWWVMLAIAILSGLGLQSLRARTDAEVPANAPG